MDDRVSKYPGRVRITPEDGSAPFYATVTRADEPTQEGTPLCKATLLTDETVALLGIEKEDPTVNDAFVSIGKVTQTYDCVEYITTSKIWKAPDDIMGKLTAFVFGGGGGGALYSVSSEASQIIIGGGGGGGGMLSVKKISVSPGQEINAVIGAGGAADISGAGGGTGGTSRFGDITAAGGSGGTGRHGGSGGSGGGGAGGQYYPTENTFGFDDVTGGIGGTGFLFGGGGSGYKESSVSSGGEYGGNGGSGTGVVAPTKGTPVHGVPREMRLIFATLEAVGKTADAGNSYGGSGGCGSNGGNGYSGGTGGGGGFFGAHGGSSTNGTTITNPGEFDLISGAGSGGGGFGPNATGGSGGIKNNDARWLPGGGGGGGFGPGGHGAGYGKAATSGGYAAGGGGGACNLPQNYSPGAGGPGIIILVYRRRGTK